MHRNAILCCSAVCLTIAGAVGILAAGPLNPPAGPVASSYKTLTEVEPRIAINAANTPGDNDSLLKITQPGSYYLTGNITGVPGKSGIEIANHGVTIDLNGFDLVGVAGSLDGIAAPINSLRNITVINGSIRNWGNDGLGLLTTFGCRIEGVLSSGNAHYGISLGNGGTIARSSANSNTNLGFATGFGCCLVSCNAYANGGNGISAGTSCTITNCAAYSCDANGITTGTDCSITNCVSNFNGTRGILVSSRCTVTTCSTGMNGSDGIRCGAGSFIYGNTCADNGADPADGAGIHATGTNNRIEGNNCTGADRGIDVDVAGNIIIKNTCAGNTINWTIAPGNAVAPIVVTPSNFGAISGNTYSGNIGSTDPNANFTY